MKKIIVLLTLIIILMTACQPTPEELVVQNKADDDLAEAIDQTAAPTTEPVEATATPEQTLKTEGTHVNDAGTITVNFAAEVILPEISQIPVAYIEQQDFTQEQVDKIITAFFGDAQFYDPYVYTKTELENTIIRVKQSANDLNSDFAQAKGIDNLADLQEAIDKQVASLEKEWQDALEEEPVISTSGIAESDDFYAKTQLKNKDDIGYIDYSNSAPFIYLKCFGAGGTYGWKMRRLEIQSSTEMELDMEDAEFQNARQIAQNFIDSAEIEGIKLGEAYLSMDNIGLILSGVEQKASGVVGDREFYVFCFERIVGEGTVDMTFYQCTRTEDDYSEPWYYEQIQVWVENSEIVQFIWNSPAQIGSMVNENTQLQVDYIQAMELAYQHLFIEYADMLYGTLEDIVIDIDKIEFALVRIKEQNSGNYLIVPAWKFYGDTIGRFIEEETSDDYNGDGEDYVSLYGRLTSMDSRNLITINALDGSVIGMELGY